MTEFAPTTAFRQRNFRRKSEKSRICLKLEKFPEYSADWLRTGEPPIYAAEVTIHGSGNIGNGNNNNVTTINERLLAAVEQMCETARIHAEAAKTNAETIAQILKINQQ